MDLKLLTTVFATVLLAELGDKTQLSTMLYASGAQNSKWAVFLGAAIALVTSSALAVFVGEPDRVSRQRQAGRAGGRSGLCCRGRLDLMESVER